MYDWTYVYDVSGSLRIGPLVWATVIQVSDEIAGAIVWWGHQDQ